MSGTYQSVLLTVGLSQNDNTMMHNALSNEFIIVQAVDAQGAIELLQEGKICGMLLLNLIPPCTDGWTVLQEAHKAQLLTQYPALVLTETSDEDARRRAVDMGASDVLVTLMEPHLAIKRIHNILRAVQLDALAKSSMKRIAQLEKQNERAQVTEIDELSGLNTQAAFCRKVHSTIKDRPAGSYVIVRWDIDRFKIYKDIYGAASGDELIRHIGQCYRRRPEWYSCHAGSDHFIHLTPVALFDPQDLQHTITGWLNETKNKYNFVPRIGVYIVDDPQQDVNILCDRAQLALLTLKGNYQKNLAYYDHSMREKLRLEQELISDMEEALQSGQFQVYLQPQYNYTDGSIVGAEALVRWFHPERGMIPPGVFVPVFERNGFISRLDSYMWEQVCCLLRQWLDQGRDVVPISVNISRVDIADQKLLDNINRIIEKYHIPESLLRLEITESAYMDNPDQLISTVNRLRERGFLVEMDDFGSGYSSLNMLKNVPVDVLKLDMKFLVSIDERGGNILNSVVRMAHWLDLPVIAEGVETLAQANYLNSVGCVVMQGYYYAKPMPVSDFEALMDRTTVSAPEESLPNTAVEGNLDFIDPTTQQALLFSSFVGGAAIMEYDGVELESVRTNERYLEELNTTHEAYHTYRRGLLQYVCDDYRQVLVDAMEKAEQTGEQQACEIRIIAIPPNEGFIWLHIHIRYLARNMNHRVFYFDISNTTAQQELMENYLRLNDEMNAIINNVPGGIIHFELDHSGVRIMYCNDGVPALFGYDQEEFIRRFANAPAQAIHPDDRELLKPLLAQAITGNSGEKHVIRYRTRMKNGGWRWTEMYAQKLNSNHEKQFITAIVIGADEVAQKEQLLKETSRELDKKTRYLQTLYHALPCGVMRFVLDENQKFTLARFNESAWQILGYDSELQYCNAIFDGNVMRDVHPDDCKQVSGYVKRLLESGASQHFEFRIVRVDGAVRWVQLHLKRFDTEGEVSVMAIYTDITDQVKNQTRMYREALLNYLDELYEIDLAQDTLVVKDKRNTSVDVQGFRKFINQWCMHVVAEEDRVRLQNFFDEIQTDESPLRTIRHRLYHKDSGRKLVETVLLDTGDSRFLMGIKYLPESENVSIQHTERPELIGDPYGTLQHGEEETLPLLATLDYSAENDVLYIRMIAKDGAIRQEKLVGYMNGLASIPHPLNSVKAITCMRQALSQPGNYVENYGCEVPGGQMGWYRVQLLSLAEANGAVTHVTGMLMDNRERITRNAISRGLSDDFGNITCNFQYSLVEMLMRATASGCDSTHNTITSIMRNVGDKLGLRRLYIVREDAPNQWSTAFEWCAGGVGELMPLKQPVMFDSSINGSYYNYFDSNGVLNGPQRLHLYPELATLPYPLDTALHVTLEYGGGFHGFVGFEFSDVKEIDANSISIAMVVSMSFAILMGQRARLRESLQKDLKNKQVNQHVQDRYNCIMKQTGVHLLNWNESRNEFGVQFFHQDQNRLVDDQGHTVIEHIHPFDRENLIIYFQDELWKQNASLELRVQMMDGTYRWMRLGSAQQERRPDGEINIIAALVDMDEEANASEALVESNQRFEDIVDNIPIGIAIYEIFEHGNTGSQIVFASENMSALFGLDLNDFAALHQDDAYCEFLPESPATTPAQVESFWCGETIQLRKSIRRLDGRHIWLNYVCKLLQRRGKLYCYVSANDITEQVEQERRQVWQQERYRIISEIDNIVVFDYSPSDDVMTFSKTNPGQQAQEEIHPNYLRNMDSRTFYIHQDDIPAMRRCLTEASTNVISGSLEFMGKYFCDEYRWQRIRYTSVADEAGKVYRVVGCIDDVNEARVLHNQLQKQAHMDGTTGLLNKDTGHSSIETALGEVADGQTDGVLFIDLDNFKGVNDTLGHMEGDAVLKQVASCLNALFRLDDIIARFGGDEFIVYMRNIQNVSLAEKKARAVTEQIAALKLKNGEHVQCSIGLTVVQTRENFSDVFERIDAALYLAKTAGKNCYRVLLRKEEE